MVTWSKAPVTNEDQSLAICPPIGPWRLYANMDWQGSGEGWAGKQVQLTGKVLEKGLHFIHPSVGT